MMKVVGIMVIVIITLVAPTNFFLSKNYMKIIISGFTGLITKVIEPELTFSEGIELKKFDTDIFILMDCSWNIIKVVNKNLAELSFDVEIV